MGRMRDINRPSPKSSILRTLDDWVCFRLVSAEIVSVMVCYGMIVCINFQGGVFGLFFWGK